MAESLKTVFAEVCKDVKIDLALMKRIHRFRIEFATKNPDHVKFLGSNLLGHYPFRFRDEQRAEWFDDILNIDEEELRSRIVALPTINEDFVRITDAMNQSCCWLVSAIYHSKLSTSQKEVGMKDVLTILQYKFLSSIMAHNFKFPSDLAVAQATAAAMTRKFLLKIVGSWGALIDFRTDDILSKTSVHHDTIVKHGPDAAVGYMITDIQQRLREYVKNLTELFYEVRASGNTLRATSSTVELNGQVIVKDKQRTYTTYTRYLHDVIGDRPTFIRSELVQVIISSMHTTPQKLLEEALTWISDNHRAPGVPEVEQLVDETLVHAYSVVLNDKSLANSGSILVPLIARLRALYMASRMVDPSLLKMKALSDKVVRQAVKTRNESVISSVRTSVMLYLVLRAFAKEHYS